MTLGGRKRKGSGGWDGRKDRAEGGEWGGDGGGGGGWGWDKDGEESNKAVIERKRLSATRCGKVGSSMLQLEFASLCRRSVFTSIRMQLHVIDKLAAPPLTTLPLPLSHPLSPPLPCLIIPYYVSASKKLYG